MKLRLSEKSDLKCIVISLRLFGESYSSLEYDYKGLWDVYEFLNDTDIYLYKFTRGLTLTLLLMGVDGFVVSFFSSFLRFWRRVSFGETGCKILCGIEFYELDLKRFRHLKFILDIK